MSANVALRPSNWKKAGHERKKFNLVARFLTTNLDMAALRFVHLLRGATEEQGKEEDMGKLHGYLPAIGQVRRGPREGRLKAQSLFGFYYFLTAFVIGAAERKRLFGEKVDDGFQRF